MKQSGRPAAAPRLISGDSRRRPARAMMMIAGSALVLMVGVAVPAQAAPAGWAAAPGDPPTVTTTVTATLVTTTRVTETVISTAPGSTVTTTAGSVETVTTTAGSVETVTTTAGSTETVTTTANHTDTVTATVNNTVTTTVTPPVPTTVTVTVTAAQTSHASDTPHEGASGGVTSSSTTGALASTGVTFLPRLVWGGAAVLLGLGLAVAARQRRGAHRH